MTEPPASDRDTLVAALEAAGCEVKGKTVRCAFHGDRNASGSIYEGDDGRWRYKCHSCEARGDAADIEALHTGRPLAEVLKSKRADAPPRQSEDKPRRTFATIEELVSTVRDVVTVYDYSPSSLRVIRTTNKAFLQAHQMADNRWTFGGVPDPQPPYHGTDLGDGQVIVTEGEKDADALRSNGFMATTGPMGADPVGTPVEKDGKPGKVDWSALAGRDVTVWGDSDEPGKRHVERLLRVIGRVKPSSLRRVSETESKDAFAFIEAHGDGARQAVEKVLLTAELVKPAPAPASAAQATADGTEAPIAAEGLGTDLDASRELIATYGSDIRFIEGLGWCAWDGRRWKPGADSDVREKAQRCARNRTHAALRTGDRHAQKAAVESALAMESSARLTGAMREAEVDKRMRVDVDRIDAHPYLINCANGTLDLLTGTLRPHDRADLLTKLAPVDYRPGATHCLFDEYLRTLDGVIPGLTPFLARIIGMSLTSDASAESLILMQGEGGGGKTTMSEGVAAMLGDYAVKLSFSSFVLSRHGRAPGAASPDLMRLRGSRFAYAAEGDQAARLDAGIVKQLTGNEKLSARGLYAEPIEFPQTWKLWLVSNYDPRCDSEDTGLWRRIIKVVLPQVPAERRNPLIKAAMTTDPECLAAMLAWAAAGCADWLQRGGGRKGLAPPASVDGWTAEYRDAMDPLGQWSRDAGLAFGGARYIPVRDLRNSYEDWSKDNGFTPVLGRRYNAWLEDKGAERTKQRMGSETAMVWRGLHAQNI